MDDLTPSEPGSSAIGLPADAVKMRKLTKAERATVREMFDGRCAYCGDELGQRWHADHLEPVVRRIEWCSNRKRFVTNGEMYSPQNDTLANMMPACAPCNIDKGGMKLETWRTKLANGVGVLNRSSSTYRHMKRFGLVAETGAQVVFYFECVSLQRAALSEKPCFEAVKINTQEEGSS